MNMYTFLYNHSHPLNNVFYSTIIINNKYIKWLYKRHSKIVIIEINGKFKGKCFDERKIILL